MTEAPLQTGANPSHTFPDNGSWLVTVHASDGEGGSDSSGLTVNTTNVTPTIVSVPPSFATEGSLYTYLPDVHEPSDDILTWTLPPSAPAGMVLDASNGRITWTPEYSDSLTSPPTITLLVRDDDGAASLQSWTLTVLFSDIDGDGLADSWENLNGLDPELASDGLLDPDGDGLNNLDEFLSGSDPQSFDGPLGPLLISPAEGSEVATAFPWLEVSQAFDPQEDDLSYQFELFEDAALSIALAAGSTLHSSDEPSRWKVNAPLPEDTTVFWRVRANDGAASGPYSELGSFFVNSENQRPSAPEPVAPVDGALVGEPEVHLQWLLSQDAEDDEMSYLIEIYDEAGEAIEQEESEILSPHDGPSASWSVSSSLSEDHLYSWRVAALDEHGAQSEWSDPRSFQVSRINNPPTNCRLLSPVQGEQIESTAPTLTAQHGDDPDGPIVEMLFETDVSANLGTKEYASWTVETASSAPPQWDMTASGFSLPENRQVFARLRCFDSEGTSSTPHLIDFFVRGENEAPAVPSPLSPLAGEDITSSNIRLEALGHGDPEGDLHFFEFIVTRDPSLEDIVVESGLVVAAAPDQHGDSHVSWPLGRMPGDLYWSVRGVDDRGAQSSWASPLPISFRLEPAVEDAQGGCAGKASHAGARAGSLLPIVGFLLALGRRRGGRNQPGNSSREIS